MYAHGPFDIRRKRTCPHDKLNIIPRPDGAGGSRAVVGVIQWESCSKTHFRNIRRIYILYPGRGHPVAAKWGRRNPVWKSVYGPSQPLSSYPLFQRFKDYFTRVIIGMRGIIGLRACLYY